MFAILVPRFAERKRLQVGNNLAELERDSIYLSP